MQITNEMVEVAFKRALLCEGVQISFETMRAALEAAWRRHEVTQKYAPPLDNSLRECIEDLAADLKGWVKAPSPSPYDSPHYEARQASSIATLERWGLK